MIRIAAASGSQQVGTWEFDQDLITIGRSPSVNIRLTSDTVSRMHAFIETTADGRLKIRDAGSTHGTFVNSQRVSEAVISDVDDVRVGGFAITCKILHATDEEATPLPESASIELEATPLPVHVSPPTPAPVVAAHAAPAAAVAAATSLDSAFGLPLAFAESLDMDVPPTPEHVSLDSAPMNFDFISGLQRDVNAEEWNYTFGNDVTTGKRPLLTPWRTAMIGFSIAFHIVLMIGYQAIPPQEEYLPDKYESIAVFVQPAEPTPEKRDKAQKRMENRASTAKAMLGKMPQSLKKVFGQSANVLAKATNMRGSDAPRGLNMTGLASKLPGGDLQLGGGSTFGSDSVDVNSLVAGNLKKGKGGGGAVRGTVQGRASQVQVTGSLDRAQIAGVVNSHIHEVRRCYEQALLTNPSLSGKIVMEWTISPAGTVKGASTKFSTMRGGNVAGCIASKIRGWQFPKPKGDGYVIVNYPFMFEAVGF